jgi:hypothetical protein
MKYVALIAIFASQLFAGPFGLEKGMTKQQIIAQVGASAVLKNEDSPHNTALRLSTVPKPYPGFEWYTLEFDTDGGLAKISATGIDLETNGYGDALREKFAALSQQLISLYGEPSDQFDFLSSGSIWKEPQYWMMGLKQKERFLATDWQSHSDRPRMRALPNSLSIIYLRAVALSQNKGYLKLGYEFDGWENAVEQREAAGASVLK